MSALEETLDATLSDEGETAAFLAPRLAAYAVPGNDSESDSTAEAVIMHRAVHSNTDNEDAHSQNGDNLHDRRSSSVSDGGLSGVADGGRPRGDRDSVSNDVTTGVNEEMTTAGSAEACSDEDAEGDNEEVGEAAENEQMPDPDEGRQTGPSTMVFPLNRVKELLKYDSDSSIVSREAAMAASEAVVLIMRDLAKAAAGEAERKQRKTVTYEDLSRTVQLYDRFSFLSDVLPPPPSAPNTTKKVHVGASTSQRTLSTSGAPSRQRRAETQAQAHSNTTSFTSASSHVRPGGQWEQPTLRF